jgi:DNA-binding NtrC family response regulator
VRQLENAIFRAVVLAEGETLGVNEFPQIAAQRGEDGGNAPDASPAALAHSPPISAVAIVPDAAPQLTISAPSLALLSPQGDVRPLDEVERDVIRFAIAHYRGQMSEVARRLQIGRSTLYRKLESLGLETENADAG